MKRTRSDNNNNIVKIQKKKKEELNRGAWTDEEDKILRDYIITHGEGKWSTLPNQAGLKRCGKSCRLRWKNYLRPGIKRGNISSDEEELIIRLHNLLGNRWSLIAGRLPGRTDNEIKNYWNSNLRKRIAKTQTNQNQNQQQRITKHSNNVGVIRTKAIRCCSSKALNLTLEKHTLEEEPDHQVVGSSSLLGDLEFDFDKIQSDEFLFPDLLDFDGLGCENVTPLVSSEEILGDFVHPPPDTTTVQGNLDLNRPLTSSCLHRGGCDDEEDWLQEFNCC